MSGLVTSSALQFSELAADWYETKVEGRCILSRHNITLQLDGKTSRPVSSLETKTKIKGPQEAQLLQRDRAMLRVIEYFSKSINVTQDHSK